MTDANKVRETVSKAYADAITQEGGCCGPRTPKGVAAKTAGYGAADTTAIPDGAVENSFGCGNPLAFSGVKPGDTVIDLGSGAGLDLLIAARKVGPTGRVIGVDMTDEMIAKARANVAAAGFSNVEVRKGVIEALPVESGSVDWVISNCVINLSPEKEKVFAEIARVLKPGGRMLVSDIVVRDLPSWVRASVALHSACVAGAISEEDYAAGLRAAGMEDVEVRARHHYDATQLRELARSEVASLFATTGSPCCGGRRIDDLLDSLARAADGKVWSATIFAKRSV